MTELRILCPYCGKPVANSEKLARHLARECPAVSTQERLRHTGETPSEEPRQEPRS